MNSPAQRPDDALLSAWLDGEVEGADCARIQAWLQEHPEDAARVRLWAADRDALRARFTPTLDEPIPERLTQAVWRRSGERRGWSWGWPMQAAAAVVLFALGIGHRQLVARQHVGRADGRRRPQLDAARRGGACGVCARGAPPGRGERARGRRGATARTRGAPVALADAPAVRAGEAVRSARPGLRARRRPSAARCVGTERAVDVPRHAWACA